MTRQTWLVDNVFPMIPGTAHTIFNPGMFANNFLRMIDFASLLGVFPVLMGDSKSAPISNEDMARAAAVLLTGDPSKYAGKSYRPTGAQLLSGSDMARIIAKVVNHAVVPVKLPLWMFRKVARMQKVDPYSIALLIQYIEDSKRGAFEFEGGVTQVMEELTGSSAESFEITARRYAELPFAQQTLSNRVKAFINFNIAPFYPAYDIEAYERKLESPSPRKPLYCMEDTRWKKSHAEQMSAKNISSYIRFSPPDKEAEPARLCLTPKFE
jgi:hypothetical protein